MASSLMSLSDPSWLLLWEWMEFLSIIVIGVGCWGEGWAEHRKFSVKAGSSKTAAQVKKGYMRVFWRMVVIGLGIELFAFGFSFLASNREIEGLHKANLELQAKLQPRRITAQQMKNFIFLTEKVPKIPIRICMGPPKDEVINYAYQIQVMTTKAGYKIPDSDTNNVFGIHVDQTAFIYSPALGNTNQWEDLHFLIDNTNAIPEWLPGSHTNGFSRPEVPEGDTNGTYVALVHILNEIGIETKFVSQT